MKRKQQGLWPEGASPRGFKRLFRHRSQRPMRWRLSNIVGQIGITTVYRISVPGFYRHLSLVLAWKSPCFAEYIPTWMILCSINCRIKDQIQSHSARFFTAFLSSPRRVWRKKRVRRSPSLFLPGHRTAGRCPNWRTSAPARRPGQGLDEAMVYSWFS